MGDFFHKLTDNFDAFTYSQKTVANYLIDNQDNVAFDTLEDLAEKIEAVELELAEREAEYEKQKSIVRTFEENEPFAHTYIETYNAYMLYKEQVEKFGEENITISEKHLTAKENLNDAELQEVREFIRGCGQEKREANRQYSYITYLHSK